jgi:hypothetical protein
MKTILALAAAGVFALSTTALTSNAWAGEGHNCGGYLKSVQTEKPTITLATTPATVKSSPKQTASTEVKTTKPGS